MSRHIERRNSKKAAVRRGKKRVAGHGAKTIAIWSGRTLTVTCKSSGKLVLTSAAPDVQPTRPPKWLKTVGMFRGDEGMDLVYESGAQARAADRITLE